MKNNIQFGLLILSFVIVAAMISMIVTLIQTHPETTGIVLGMLCLFVGAPLALFLSRSKH